MNIIHKMCLHSVTKCYGVVATELMSLIQVIASDKLEISARESCFVVNAIQSVYTAQIHSAEFGYLDIRRNGVVAVEDTLLKLRHE